MPTFRALSASTGVSVDELVHHALADDGAGEVRREK
jgi:hypothetical protein